MYSGHNKFPKIGFSRRLPMRDSTPDKNDAMLIVWCMVLAAAASLASIVRLAIIVWD